MIDEKKNIGLNVVFSNKLLGLLLLINSCNSFSNTITNERSWVTGPNNIRGYLEIKPITSMGNLIFDHVKARTRIVDQYGYLGLETTTGFGNYYL